MDSNYSDFPQSLKVGNQAPLDAKTMVNTIEELKDLGIDNYKAFTYYRGMLITCLEDNKIYQWTDNLQGKEKILPEDFVYPNVPPFGGINYSGLIFNFVEFKGTDGKDGKDGIDGKDGKDGNDGTPGQDGDSAPILYSWTMFANDNLGGGISKNHINTDGTYKKYIGFAFNKPVKEPSTDYTQYTWTPYVGEDGMPGENGYVWMKYSLYPLGRDSANRVSMYDKPFNENINEWMVYMGFAYNKQTKEESDIPEDYLWSKIKGDDGHSGYVLDLSNDNVTVPANSDGTLGTTALEFAQTEVRLYYGNDIIKRTDYFLSIVASDGVNFEWDETNEDFHIVKITDLPLNSDVSSLIISAYSDINNQKLLGKSTFNISKIKGTSSYNILVSTNTILVQPAAGGNPEKIIPTKISAKIIKNSGNGIEEVNEGILAYKYSYQLPMEKGTPIQPNTDLTISNDNSPYFLDFLFYHPSNGLLVDKETIPFVRDGKPGSDGAPGSDGQDGEPGVPGDRGPMARQLEWRVGVTYVNNSQFRDYIYYRSSDLTYEGWYITKGIQGVANQGFPDLAIFEKQPFIESSIFGTIIAENANLAGFIFKAQQMFSQAGMENKPIPTYSNMLINGILGYIKFLKNFEINSNGIYFSDTDATSDNKLRLSLEFAGGTPRLRMWHPNGNIGIEMGIIDGVLTLNFYNSDGVLVYKLGQGGIVYVDRVPASFNKSYYHKFTASYDNDAALKAEYITKMDAILTSTVNEGPENKHTNHRIEETQSFPVYSYYAGKNENSEANKVLEGMWENSNHPFIGITTNSKLNAIITTGSQVRGNSTFHGVRTYGPYIEYNRQGYLKPTDFTNPNTTGVDIIITVSKIENGVTVAEKIINLGPLTVNNI